MTRNFQVSFSPRKCIRRGNSCPLSAVPSGLGAISIANPALKRWAIPGHPSGMKEITRRFHSLRFQPSLRDLIFTISNPALKRRAIVTCPSGTEGSSRNFVFAYET
jgi:hypothetical protein